MGFLLGYYGNGNWVNQYQPCSHRGSKLCSIVWYHCGLGTVYWMQSVCRVLPTENALPWLNQLIVMLCRTMSYCDVV